MQNQRDSATGVYRGYFQLEAYFERTRLNVLSSV